MSRLEDPAGTNEPRPLPRRDPAGHKGSFGTVLVVGGSVSSEHDLGTGRALTMLGAPVLAARAAVRGGAGLVRLAVPRPLIVPAMQMLPEVTAVGLEADGEGTVVPHAAAEAMDAALAGATSAVVGPGLGVNDGSRAVVTRVLGQEEVPVVLDADGLNTLAGLAEAGGIAAQMRAPTVLTPHPGEFRRLCDGLGVPKRGEQAGDAATRPAAAEDLARRVGCVVVLKGAGTVVSDGLRTWVCDRGHHCMGTGGTGDVLAGLIGALVAQFVGRADEAGPRAIGGMIMPLPPGRIELFDAACRAVLAHAIAGERWARSRGGEAAAGMLASELADLLPEAIAAARGGE